MSAKAFDALSKSSDVSKNPQTAQSQGSSDSQEKNQKVVAARKNLVRVGSLAVLAFVVWLFATIAWFTSNKDVGGSGMGVKVGADAYQIVPVDGNDSIFQEYYNYMENSSIDALVWKMTAENNMDNYDSDNDTGISPGAYGKISFYVKPRDESIDLDLSFSIDGYKYTEQSADAEEGGAEITTSEAETTTQEKVKTMTPVSDELKGYLAGHIFLFLNREDTYDKPEGVEGRKIVSSIYSNPILSQSDLSKVIRSRNFTRENQDTAVDIYWVWPKTLSTLVDATENANVTITPFSESIHRKAIEDNIIAYPNYYFYQYSDIETTLTADILSDEYDKYGDLYDRVDNEIGLNVSYITLKMTSSVSSQTTAVVTSEQQTTTTTTNS